MSMMSVNSLMYSTGNFNNNDDAAVQEVMKRLSTNSSSLAVEFWLNETTNGKFLVQLYNGNYNILNIELFIQAIQNYCKNEKKKLFKAQFCEGYNNEVQRIILSHINLSKSNTHSVFCVKMTQVT